MSLPRTVFITSDWHLGGSVDKVGDKGAMIPGTQICRSITRLVEFIDWVRTQIDPQRPQVELVINGDSVDFLAPEDGYDPRPWLGDEAAAAHRFTQIADAARGTDGRGPFEALRDFLAAGGEVTLLLGNHDLELSLPAVRRALATRLESDGRRFTFIYDGEAHVRGRLLIEHGNRYDAFNLVDYSRLRQERSHLSRGLRCAPGERDENFFLPPYGSELVANVYNRLLPQVPFLNLLKPETAAALPLVLALCPESRRVIDIGLIVYGVGRTTFVNRLQGPAQPRNAGQLAAPTGEEYRSVDDLLQQVLGYADAALFAEARPHAGQLAADSFATRLAGLAEKGRELATAADSVSTVLKIFLPGGDARRLAQVRCALKKVHDEVEFSLAKEQANYADAAQELVRSGQFSTVVFGHTHLPKEVALAGGTYLNAGTWASVIRLPVEVAGGPTQDETIKQFVEDMIAKRISRYLVCRLTYVEAHVAANGATTACLRQFLGPQGPTATVLPL